MEKVVVAEEKLMRDTVIRKATTRRKVDWKKIVSYLAGILSIIIGIILIICNQTKIVPAEWGTSLVTDFIYFCISCGLFSGGLLVVFGVCVFIQIEDEKQKPRRKRRTRY